MKRTAPKPLQGRPIRGSVREAIYEMETDLADLHGFVALLTILSEAQDSIDPAALSVLARSGRSTYEALSTAWRMAFEGIRS